MTRDDFLPGSQTRKCLQKQKQISNTKYNLRCVFQNIMEYGKNYSTSYSRVISHHSTDDAITSLTSEIGRDPVLSSVYGRSWRD